MKIMTCFTVIYCLFEFLYESTNSHTAKTCKLSIEVDPNNELSQPKELQILFQ